MQFNPETVRAARRFADTAIDSNKFTITEKLGKKSLVAELSDLQLPGPPQYVLVVFPSSAVEVFNFTKPDMDASGEDIAGWNYTGNMGSKLLLIND